MNCTFNAVLRYSKTTWVQHFAHIIFNGKYTKHSFMGHIMHKLITHHLNESMYRQIDRKSMRWWKKQSHQIYFGIMNVSWRTNSIHVLSTIVLCVGLSSSSSSSSLWNESKTGNCNTTFNRTTMMMMMRYIECISLSTWNWQDIVVDENRTDKIVRIVCVPNYIEWNGREREKSNSGWWWRQRQLEENNSITQNNMIQLQIGCCFYVSFLCVVHFFLFSNISLFILMPEKRDSKR